MIRRVSVDAGEDRYMNAGDLRKLHKLLVVGEIPDDATVEVDSTGTDVQALTVSTLDDDS